MSRQRWLPSVATVTTGSASLRPRRSFSWPGLACMVMLTQGPRCSTAHASPQTRPSPTFRQVHLLHAELFAELDAQGFAVQPGQLGEIITTQNLDLLALPCGTQLRIGPEAVVEVTGLRNPCAQINAFQPRLLNAVLGRDGNGEVMRKGGIMGIVVTGGGVAPGDGIVVCLPAEPHRALERV
jgi:MOSC domain-containing protein YiiM